MPQTKRDKLDKKAEAGVFVGYNTVSKAYRVFQLHTRKILISRDVHFMEDEQWNWKEAEPTFIPDQSTLLWLKEDQLVHDIPVRGTRSLFDIYQRCNMVVLESTNFWEVEKDPKWRAAMKEELTMIEKNQTWKLVKRPEDRKVIGVKWIFRTKLECRWLYQ